MKDQLIDSSECHAFIKRILDQLGATPKHSQRWSEILVETSLLGIDSHGIRMLPRYIIHMEGGGIDLSSKHVVILINTSTGGLIDEEALYQALTSGEAGACFD